MYKDNIALTKPHLYLIGSEYKKAADMTEDEKINFLKLVFDSTTPNNEFISEIDKKLESDSSYIVTTKEFRKMYDLDLHTNHTGKMALMDSISTCCWLNDNCQKYRKTPGSICEKCFAHSDMKVYFDVAVKTVRHSKILSTVDIPIKHIPMMNVCIYRFEAFGDLINSLQFSNYCKIAMVNKSVKFAIWTKSPHIIQEYIDNGDNGGKIPKNLMVIYSALMINQSEKVTNKIMNKYSFLDKSFTVYDENYIQENDIKINCGALNCFTCQKCYHKNKHNIISEKLKV